MGEVARTYLSSNQDLQLAAVYALQVFCFARSFPKGMLLRWFVSFYEADIVDERGFLKWRRMSMIATQEKEKLCSKSTSGSPGWRKQNPRRRRMSKTPEGHQNVNYCEKK